MNMTSAVSRSRASLFTTAAFVLALAYIPSVQAQSARVAAIQHVVEVNNGGGWGAAGVGAGINGGGACRTGKRSKVDIKFGDGSLIRLGQLSSVAIVSGQKVNLVSGGLLFSVLHPGFHVVAGTGEAAIMGSSGIVRRNEDGTVTFDLYSGRMDVITPKGTVHVPPGFEVTARVDGTLTALHFAPPFSYSTSAAHGGGDLSQPPANAPYVGSTVNVSVRTSPTRTTLDNNTTQTVTNGTPSISSSNPYGRPLNSSNPNNPFPQPFPTGPQPVPTVFPTVQSEGARFAFDAAGAPAAGNQNAGMGGPVDQVNSTQLQTVDITQALDHIDESDHGLGEVSGGDIALIGALQSGGGQAYGADLHTFSGEGHWLVDLSAVPLHLRVPGPNGPVQEDSSAITSAYVNYRDRRYNFELGRQSFVQGPTQVTLFGSLIRQGGREIMDAARFSPQLGGGQKLEVALIYDAFVRNLPYRVPTGQKGYYARYGLQKPFANIGINVLGYSESPVPTSTGATVDLAIPLLRDQIEVYGEAGRDTFRRQLRSMGVTFPGLYDRTDLDVYLEYANLQSSSLAGRPPTELALRVYRSLGENIDLVSELSRFYGSSTLFTVGVSVGAHVGSHG